MGLSYYYSNWGANPDMGCSLFQQNNAIATPLEELAPELLSFHENFSPENSCIDPIFDPHPIIPPHDYYYDYSSSIDHNVVSYSSDLDLLPPLPETFPSPYLLLDSSSSNFEYYPKRQKTFHDHDINTIINYRYSGEVLFDSTASFGNALLPIANIPALMPDLPLEFFLPLPDHHEFQHPKTSCSTTLGEDDHLLPPAVMNHELTTATTSTSTGTTAAAAPVNVKKGTAAGTTTTLSAQSMAARLRRKKITEKTQELGKLIPGGHKMNTAEMFQAASKYIKFLQAQVGILQSMPSIQENESDEEFGKEFEELVTSPLVQEKLYMAEKCLVPKRLVEATIANDPQLQSKPQLSKEIHQLMKISD